MKAADAKKRYKLTYVPAPPAQAKWYHFLKIEAVSSADKADFSEARLVLMADTFLPRQVWYRDPTGNEVTWDLSKVVNNAQIPVDTFAPPQLPAGWQFFKVPRQNAPLCASTLPKTSGWR